MTTPRGTQALATANRILTKRAEVADRAHRRQLRADRRAQATGAAVAYLAAHPPVLVAAATLLGTSVLAAAAVACVALWALATMWSALMAMLGTAALAGAIAFGYWCMSRAMLASCYETRAHLEGAAQEFGKGKRWRR